MGAVSASMVAVLLCVAGGGVVAQIQGDHAFAGTCDMSTLFSQVDSVAAECSPSSCTASCLAALLPVLDDCHDVIDRLYDGEDGVEDGEASVFSNQYDQCAAIPPASLIDQLKALQDRGQCPPTALDGVAATEVKAPGCTDRWEGDHCSQSIASGIMTCEHDFCDTDSCILAGQCDRSCNLCADDGGGHRRLLSILASLRRLQLSHMACSPSSFEAEAAAVDAACCDSERCTSGIPGECDAKCGVVFNSFYSRCQRFLASQFSVADMAGYDQLFATCTRGLPTEPLLRALVVCTANPPDPCFGVECGEHGHCDDGTCRCEQGYSGRSCDVFDPCFGVDCGGHGHCVGGSCVCEDNYTGASCEVFVFTPGACCSMCPMAPGADRQASDCGDCYPNQGCTRREDADICATHSGAYTAPVGTLHDDQTDEVVDCTDDAHSQLGGCGYNVGYGDNLDCTTTITAGANQVVALSFTQVNLESGDRCGVNGVCDYVEIFDGPSISSPSLGQFSGSDLPGAIRSTGSSVTVHFDTDEGNADITASDDPGCDFDLLFCYSAPVGPQ
eukprot:SAG31_NODE_5615_length_2423_cov_2.452668_1_plen_558_part_00